MQSWDSVIPKISSKELSVARFYDEFMLKNRPVIITEITEGWEALNWINAEGSLNSSKVRESFGTCQVTVHNCSKQIQDLGRLETIEMTVGEYLNWWDGRALQSSENLLYLKDWNFCKDFPE